MKPTELKTQAAPRVSRHRKRIAAGGAKRVEVTVSVRDAPLVKAIAAGLRSDGEQAQRVRQSLQPMLKARRANTGAELVAFLRVSPLNDTELVSGRDSSTGRSAHLG